MIRRLISGSGSWQVHGRGNEPFKRRLSPIIRKSLARCKLTVSESEWEWGRMLVPSALSGRYRIPHRSAPHSTSVVFLDDESSFLFISDRISFSILNNKLTAFTGFFQPAQQSSIDMPFTDETWLRRNLDDSVVLQLKLGKKLKDFVYISILLILKRSLLKARHRLTIQTLLGIYFIWCVERLWYTISGCSNGSHVVPISSKRRLLMAMGKFR